MRQLAAKSREVGIVVGKEPPAVLSVLTVRAAYHLAVDRCQNWLKSCSRYRKLTHHLIFGTSEVKPVRLRAKGDGPPDVKTSFPAFSTDLVTTQLGGQEGGFLSAGARGKAGMFPELFPLPDVGRLVEDGVAELVGEHLNLASMVGFVGEHVGEHGASGGPGGHPTVAKEFRNAAIGSSGESIRQHAEGLRGAFLECGGSLLFGAAVGIERRRALQMRGGALQPLQAHVVQMREDGGDGAAAAFFAGRLGAPGTRVEMGEDELVHGVVGRVGLEQGIANLGERGVG